jgi:hypothetical protein
VALRPDTSAPVSILQKRTATNLRLNLRRTYDLGSLMGVDVYGGSR